VHVPYCPILCDKAYILNVSILWTYLGSADNLHLTDDDICSLMNLKTIAYPVYIELVWNVDRLRLPDDVFVCFGFIGRPTIGVKVVDESRMSTK